MKKSWTKSSHQILKQATGLNRYNLWIFSLFKQYLGNNILELGSGLGGLSQYLPKKNTTLSDIQPEYLKQLESQFGFKTKKLNIEKDSINNIKSQFDTILSTNVFEHLQDDQKALDNCFKILSNNGKLLLFVPARPEIYGSLDEAMGHHRRYTKKELMAKTKKAGFQVLKTKYVNFPGYFTWWFRGRFPSKSNSDNLLAEIFESIIVPLLHLEKYLPTPLGQSLMLIAQKP